MTSREVFEQAREATLSMERIRVLSELMHERIGMQGRAMESAFSQNLDPMRKVDDLIDWEVEEYRTAMESSREALAEAHQLLRGLLAMGCDEAEETLRLVYVDAKDVEKVAALLDKPEEAVTMMCEMSFRWIDHTGMARVKEAGREQAR